MARNDIDARDLKAPLLAFLRDQHPTVCRRWFTDLETLGIVDGALQVRVGEQVQLKYLRRCCSQQFSEAAQAVTGKLLAVRFVGEEEEQASGGVGNQRPTGGIVMADGDEDLLLSPDYNFDNFVMGPGNRLAHAAAIAVARSPGRAYNPLFIHGGVGLGKTHLLQAVCQMAMHHHRDLRIYYISCDGFMTRFLEAVQAGEMASFRHRFRAFDMLVIDDIHDLSRRDRTQEEFFHTFNTLFQSGRQVVLSSDAPPGEIPDLEERLISRFGCGLVAAVDPPSFETRVAIIRQKAALRDIDIPADVAAFVAAKLDSNVRELEGAIMKLQGLSLVEGAPIDLDMARVAINSHVSTAASAQHLSIQDILDTIMVYYDVKLTDLLSRRRHKSITTPRQVGMWLARRHTRYSLEEIGGYFGGRDHTTVIHAVRTVDTRRQDNEQMGRDITQLEGRLSQRQG